MSQHQAGTASPSDPTKAVEEGYGKPDSYASSINSRRHLLDKAIRSAQSWGLLESRGIAPVPIEERIDTHFYSLVRPISSF